MLFLQSAMKSSLSTLLDQENGEPAVNLQAMRQLNQIVAQKTLGLGWKQCKKLILVDDAQNYWEKTKRFFRGGNHLASMKQQYDSWYQFQPYGQVGLSSRGRNFYLDAKKLNSCPSTKGRMDTSAWSPLLLFWIAGSGTAKISLEQNGRANPSQRLPRLIKKVRGMLRQRNAKSWLCVPIYSHGSKLGYQRDYWFNQVKYGNHPLRGLKLLTHSHTCLWTCMGDCDCVSVGVCMTRPRFIWHHQKRPFLFSRDIQCCEGAVHFDDWWRITLSQGDRNPKLGTTFTPQSAWTTVNLWPYPSIIRVSRFTTDSC